MSVLELTNKTIVVHGEPVVITNDTIRATCEWYANNQQACINEAQSGEVKVNDLQSYIAECELLKQQYQSGDFTTGLWFWQRAYFIQSGCSVPMLSR